MTTFEGLPSTQQFHVCADVHDGVDLMDDESFPDFFYDGVVYGISAMNPQVAACLSSHRVAFVVGPLLHSLLGLHGALVTDKLRGMGVMCANEG